MIAALRTAVAKRIEVLVDLGGIAFALSGATAAAVFGKALLAVALGALALGFFLRLSGRGASSKTSVAGTPAWIFAVSGLLSLVEVGVLVEASNLPVRYTQDGFELSHWVLVLLAFGVAFFAQVRAIRHIAYRGHGKHVL